MFTHADRALATLARSQHGIFTRADARQSGLSNHQIDARIAEMWTEVHRGVFRSAGAVSEWEGDLYAACRAATGPAGVSHRSGAALYALPGGDRTVHEITCRRWKRTQKPGLLVHESTRFDDVDITQVNGIPVVTAERLILEMAGLRPYPDYLERLIQAARRKRLISYDSTLQTFNRLARRGVPGVQAMRVALERWDPRFKPTDSDMETLLTQLLRDNGLPAPVTQFIVLDQFGNFVAQADAALPQWKITLEYQSKQEHLDEFQSLADDRRRNKIIEADYLPLAARWEDLCNGGRVLVDQIETIARRTAS